MMIFRPKKLSQVSTTFLSPSLSLTGYNGDCLESPEYSEGPEGGQVTNDRGQEAGHDHEEVQPVPGTSQVRVTIHDESHGQDFDYHLSCVDDQESKSTTDSLSLYDVTENQIN